MSTNLQAKERSKAEGFSAKKIRREGGIPGIVYGSKMESKQVSVNSLDFAKTLKTAGRNGIISLDVDGNKQDVILADYQKNSLNNEITHADFLAVDKSSKLHVDVAVVLAGEAAGVKDGGVLQQPLFQVSITSSPDDIPSSIEVDVSNLQVGETITVADLKTNGSYTVNHEDDEVVASILPPKAEEEIDSGEQQDGGIPENEEGRETPPES